MRTTKPIEFVLIAALAIPAMMAAPSARAQQTPAGTTPDASAADTQTVPVSTPSKTAREDYELGMFHREELLYVEDGIDFFRKAIQADPHFALGHATLGFFTSDPAEEVRELALAKSNLSHAAPDEKVLIRWMMGTKNGNLVPAIAAMNDLLEKYPNDKRLTNMFAEWLLGPQQNYNYAAKMLEKILKTDPEYYPALNNLAYAYALGGRAELSPPLMDRYVAALPGQPNPQDSYGEILRMMGDFPGALEHYRASLKIAPNFVYSQDGIASTYALMGDEDRARLEYVKAIDMAKERTDKMDFRILWAMTYYRENRPGLARKAFNDIAAEAHQQNLPVEEAECHRDMALFNPDPEGQLKDMEAATEVMISDKHEILQGTRELELAKIFQTKAYIAARAGNASLTQRTFEQLNNMAQSNRDNVVMDAYHSANGASLLLKGKFADAISELQEDPRNPLSLRLLADAESKAGETAEAEKTLATLAAINDETVEMASLVPPVRAALKSNVSKSAQDTSH